MKASSEIGDAAAAALFNGPGEIPARCREIDWAATPLGPVATWPEALRGAVRLCLDSAFPMCVHAGAAQVLIYNDANIGTFNAEKHPWALGRPAREVWAEVWDDVAPIYAALLEGEPAEYREDAPYAIRRDGVLQDTFWTYSRSPIRDTGTRCSLTLEGGHAGDVVAEDPRPSPHRRRDSFACQAAHKNEN